MLQLTNALMARLLIALFVVAVLAALVCARQNTLALNPGEPTDLTYYLQFAAKGLDAHPQAFFVPTVGTSVVYTGADGRASLHKGIHFEPPKYIVAALYSLTHSPLVLFGFYILLLFSPLLYAAFLVAKGAAGRELFLAGLCFALLPAAYSVAVDDLRPFTLVAAFFTLCMLACLYRRPRAEELALLALLVLSREEGVFFALPILAFAAARAWREKGSVREVWPMLGVWLAGLAAVAGYMWWIKSVYDWRQFGAVSHMVVAAQTFALGHAVFTLLCVVSVVLAAVYIGRRYFRTLYPHAEVFAFAGLMAVFLVAAPVFKLTPPVFTPAILDGRYGLFLFLCAGFSALAWALGAGRLPSIRIKTFAIVLAGAVVAAAGYQYGVPASEFRHVQRSYSSAGDSELVWAASRTVSPDSFIIADGRTEQALYSRPNVAVYAALPAYPVANPQDFYPNNRNALVERLAAHSDSYAVVGVALAPALAQLAREAGKELVPVETNSTFGFYAVR